MLIYVYKWRSITRKQARKTAIDYRVFTFEKGYYFGVRLRLNIALLKMRFHQAHVHVN